MQEGKVSEADRDLEEHRERGSRGFVALLVALTLYCPHSVLPSLCIALQDDLDINFEAKKQEVPKITSPNLDYPALSDAVLVAKSYEKGWYKY